MKPWDDVIPPSEQKIYAAAGYTFLRSFERRSRSHGTLERA